MWHFASLRWGIVVVVLGSQAVWGQIDPERRQLIQMGYNQPLEGIAPIAAYGYFYENLPDFPRTNLTLRLALAPIYVDAELGIGHAIGPNTDIGIGIAGGGFADTYSELRQGKYWREESFTGHGGEVSVNVYHRFNPGATIPLYAVLRNALHYSLYERNGDTAPNFVIPDDQYTYHVRAGLRWGGIEPMLQPAVALEASAWYEGAFRTDAGGYGYNSDRFVNGDSHRIWARTALDFTHTNSLQSFEVSATAGTSIRADRLSAYRIGGMLPLAAEFPLSLPGFFYQELSARRFILFNGQYSIAADYANHWHLTAFGATALVDYLPGEEQPGAWNSGVGGGITYLSSSQTWRIMVSYAYGLDAIRSSGRGANMVSLLCQFDLEAKHRRRATGFQPLVSPDRLRGFDWLLGR